MEFRSNSETTNRQKYSLTWRWTIMFQHSHCPLQVVPFRLIPLVIFHVLTYIFVLSDSLRSWFSLSVIHWKLLSMFNLLANASLFTCDPWHIPMGTMAPPFAHVYTVTIYPSVSVLLRIMNIFRSTPKLVKMDRYFKWIHRLAFAGA